MYRNNGDLSFTYVTNTTGVGQITLLNSGWGARFVDMNNDGLRDLFVAQSHVLDTVEKSTAYLKYKQPLLLMTNTGKGFVNVSATAGAAFNTAVAARGAAFGDPRIVVGLGNAKAVKSIEVRWPSGRVQTIANPGIDRYLQISEAK